MTDKTNDRLHRANDELKHLRDRVRELERERDAARAERDRLAAELATARELLKRAYSLMYEDRSPETYLEVQMDIDAALPPPGAGKGETE